MCIKRLFSIESAARRYGLLLLLLLQMTIYAAAKDSHIEWHDLGARERKILHQFESEWPQLTIQQQLLLITAADRWSLMQPEEREQARRQLDSLKKMTAGQRMKTYESFIHFQNMPPGEQEKLRSARGQYMKLSDKEREEIRQQWQSLTPEQRMRYQQSGRPPRPPRGVNGHPPPPGDKGHPPPGDDGRGKIPPPMPPGDDGQGRDPHSQETMLPEKL